jgi:hypothetical protein
MAEHYCQMTIDTTPKRMWPHYAPCGKPAKYKTPKPEMQVEYVCGIHANSLNKMYIRIGDKTRCVPL